MTDSPGLPDQAEVDETIKIVRDHADRIFLWNYDRSRDQLVTLYNKAMASQWNSVTELDWSTDVDPTGLVDAATPLQQLTRAARDVDGSPIAAWGDKELQELGVESFKAQLSQFMHGEQGAMMTAAKIVETVPW
ncbi:MAG TPA: ferritin-like domain-containing protein, partial [Acidimicrobiales bacterium]|nr:ferritin-like domain-containing protein [Acidimicrobiales bacterium]